jgi:hypothetical protein
LPFSEEDVNDEEDDDQFNVMMVMKKNTICVVCKLPGAIDCFPTCQSLVKHPVHIHCRETSNNSIICPTCCTPDIFSNTMSMLRKENSELQLKIETENRRFEILLATKQHDIDNFNINNTSLFQRHVSMKNDLDNMILQNNNMKQKTEDVQIHEIDLRKREIDLDKREYDLYTSENINISNRNLLNIEKNEYAKKIKHCDNIIVEYSAKSEMIQTTKKRYDILCCESEKLIGELKIQVKHLKRGNPVIGTLPLSYKKYPKNHCMFCGYSFINEVACGVCKTKYLS